MTLEAVDHYEVSPSEFNGSPRVRLNGDIGIGDLSALDPISMYLREIDRSPLLTREQESDLARQVVQGRLAQDRLLFDQVSAEEQDRLRQLAILGGQAKNHLMESNLRLVVSIAKKYINRGVAFLDLIQQGNIGLDRAIDKFDPQRETKLGTYATYWIRQAVDRCIKNQGRTIRLPINTHEQISNMGKTIRQLKQQFGREPTTDEIAHCLGTTRSNIIQLQLVYQTPVSLDAKVRNGDEEGEAIIADFVPDDKFITPEEQIECVSRTEQIATVLDTLPARLRRVIELRFGLADGIERTLEEVGTELGVSRERVRQIEAEALQMLRAPKVRKQLVDYV